RTCPRPRRFFPPEAALRAPLRSIRRAQAPDFDRGQFRKVFDLMRLSCQIQAGTRRFIWGGTIAIGILGAVLLPAVFGVNAFAGAAIPVVTYLFLVALNYLRIRLKYRGSPERGPARAIVRAIATRPKLRAFMDALSAAQKFEDRNSSARLWEKVEAA